MNEEEKNIGSYNVSVIEKYLQGKLSPAEMHAIEKAALDDPFLADAIDGVNLALQKNTQSLHKDLVELELRLKQRIAENKRKVVPLVPMRGWWQAAAVLVILAFSVLITYYFIYNNLGEKKNIAQETKKIQQPKTDTVRAETLTAADTMSSNANKELQREKEPAAGRASSPVDHEKNKENSKAKKDAKRVDNTTPDLAINRNEEEFKPAPVAAAEDNKSADKTTSSANFSPAGKQNSFMGKVTDEHNKPIASASVEVKDKKIAAVTDNNGNFKLNIKDDDSVVVASVRSSGYESALSDLSSNGSSNIIILKENKGNLQEVVVSNTRRKNFTKQKTSQDAMPVHGWDDYNKYLEKNKKTLQDSLGLKGPVAVSFSVNKKGKLSDFAIEQSLGPDYDEEAIRLIKEGPAWKLLKGKKATINVIVNF